VCGAGGGTCASCVGNQICQGGQCTTIDAGSCAGGTCTGCCSLGQCVPIAAQSVGECGHGNATCQACGADQVCDAGLCQNSADAGPCGSCSGCCNGATCVGSASESNAECGAGGAACASCSAPNAYCGRGEHECAPAGSGTLGAACSSDGNCELGTHTQEPWCQPWPGGYCEDTCDSMGVSPGPCPSGDYCLGMLGALGGGDYLGLCLLHCTGTCANASDLCDPSVGDGQGYCVPKCTTAQDCDTFFADPNAQCNAANGQCCGIVNFACCSGNTCHDGSSCQTGTLRCE
jgi:hypothetical protein